MAPQGAWIGFQLAQRYPYVIISVRCEAETWMNQKFIESGIHRR
jgi:hypothetical protein